MEGTYSERLQSGGELRVSAKGWLISYYFPGPDRRYNGTFVSVPGSKIDDYIQAWNLNFQEYLRLKKEHTEGQFQKIGILNMTIRIGGYFEGVCIDSYHMPIRTQEKLEAVLSDYRYAAQKADKIMHKPNHPVAEPALPEEKTSQKTTDFNNKDMVSEYFRRLSEVDSKVAVLEKTVEQLLTFISSSQNQMMDRPKATDTSDGEKRLEKILGEKRAESAQIFEIAKKQGCFSVRMEDIYTLFSYKNAQWLCSIKKELESQVSMDLKKHKYLFRRR